MFHMRTFPHSVKVILGNIFSDFFVHETNFINWIFSTYSIMSVLKKYLILEHF